MKTRNGQTGRFGRRHFLHVVCVAGVGGLAGCLGGGDDDQTDNDQTGDDQTDNDQTGTPMLREVFVWETSYVMDLVVPLGLGRITVYEGDTYTVWTIHGVEMEAYRVGTDEYIVVEDECFVATGSSDDAIFDPEALVDESGDVTATETSTIDGQDTYRFEVDDGALYVSIETGYPVRFEDDSDGGVIEFHSWGETEPISPPDMDCIEQ